MANIDSTVFFLILKELGHSTDAEIFSSLWLDGPNRLRFKEGRNINGTVVLPGWPSRDQWLRKSRGGKDYQNKYKEKIFEKDEELRKSAYLGDDTWSVFGRRETVTQRFPEEGNLYSFTSHCYSVLLSLMQDDIHENIRAISKLLDSLFVEKRLIAELKKFRDNEKLAAYIVSSAKAATKQENRETQVAIAAKRREKMLSISELSEDEKAVKERVNAEIFALYKGSPWIRGIDVVLKNEKFYLSDDEWSVPQNEDWKECGEFLNFYEDEIKTAFSKVKNSLRKRSDGMLENSKIVGVKASSHVLKGLKLELYITDYFTHRIIETVIEKKGIEIDIQEVADKPENAFLRTSLGVNVLIRLPRENKIYLVRRSKKASYNNSGMLYPSVVETIDLEHVILPKHMRIRFRQPAYEAYLRSWVSLIPKKTQNGHYIIVEI